MKNKLLVSRIFTITGILLLLAAVFLALYNVKLQSDGDKKRADVMQKLGDAIDKNKENGIKPIDSIISADERTVNDSVIIDGVAYIGYVTIPSLDIQLPISKEWDDGLLNLGACRYSGSTYQDNLIICAHNYYTYFAKIYRLQAGDEIVFTDIYDQQIFYEVTYQEVVDQYNIKDMKKSSDDWDITLFTCTLAGNSRTTIRAVRKD